MIVGIDEAGRGPLAGDVFAAAVILPEGIVIDGLTDSKKLNEKKRNMLYNVIIECAVSYCVARANVEEIEHMNILAATMLAMRRAVAGLSMKPSIALVDGNSDPHLDINTRMIIKGDLTEPPISAASIIAKVSRDRYMYEQHLKYPEYEFNRHKGYGTKLHYEKIEEYGISEIHRKSFLKKFFAS